MFLCVLQEQMGDTYIFFNALFFLITMGVLTHRLRENGKLFSSIFLFLRELSFSKSMRIIILSC